MGKPSDQYWRMEMTTFTEKLSIVLLAVRKAARDHSMMGGVGLSVDEGIDAVKRLILEEIGEKKKVKYATQAGHYGVYPAGIDDLKNAFLNDYRTELLKALEMEEGK